MCKIAYTHLNENFPEAQQLLFSFSDIGISFTDKYRQFFRKVMKLNTLHSQQQFVMRPIACIACLVGVMVFVISMTTIWCMHAVTTAFELSLVAGWSVLTGVMLVVFGTIYLIGHEVRGYLQVRNVQQLAFAMQSDDVEILRKQAQHWLRATQDQELNHAINSTTTITEINCVLEKTFSQIDAKVDQIILKESAIIGAVVGISPWPIVDSGIVALRQLRLIKRIAHAYGLRPATAGTLCLLRHVAIVVIFADVSEHATQWLSSKIPSIGGLLPAVGQALAVSVLTARVGRACKQVCNPVVSYG
jgi:uncharacterized membrane protein YcjF (UPF0283 family)